MPEAEHTTEARASAWDAEAREAWKSEDFARSRRLFEKVLEARRSLDNVPDVVFTLLHVTQAMRFEPGYQPAAALPLLEEALTLAERSDLADCIFAVQVNLAVVALEQAEYPGALALARELLAKAMGDEAATWGMLMLAGLSLAGLGLFEDAVRLYAAGSALRERLGIPFDDRLVLQQHERMLALGPERLASVELEGRSLSVERAVAQALAMTPPAHPHQHPTT
jgi:hypothetical protein